MNLYISSIGIITFNDHCFSNFVFFIGGRMIISCWSAGGRQSKGWRYNCWCWRRASRYSVSIRGTSSSMWVCILNLYLHFWWFLKNWWVKYEAFLTDEAVFQVESVDDELSKLAQSIGKRNEDEDSPRSLTSEPNRGNNQGPRTPNYTPPEETPGRSPSKTPVPLRIVEEDENSYAKTPIRKTRKSTRGTWTVSLL